MLNSVNLMGRLVRDPDLRYTQNNTPVASYTLAVDRGFKNAEGKSEADFIPIVAWSKAGEFAKNYFHKGQLVCVEGRLAQKSWEDKYGNKRTSVIFVNRAHDFYVAEWITVGGWKRRETFYTGARVGRRNS